MSTPGSACDRDETGLQVVCDHRVIFPAGHPVFADHFPGSPIVPAFMQLAELRRVVTSLLEGSVVRLQVLRVKFLKPITPEKECRLVLRRRAGGSTISFQFVRDDEEATQGELRIG